VFADLRKRLRTLDRRSAWLLLAACTLAPTWHLFFRIQLLEAAIGGAPGGGVARDLLPAFASFAAALLLMAVIPLAAARLAWGEPPAAFGLQRGDLRFGVRAAVLTASTSLQARSRSSRPVTPARFAERNQVARGLASRPWM
jgi:hypothetical protein